MKQLHYLIIEIVLAVALIVFTFSFPLTESGIGFVIPNNLKFIPFLCFGLMILSNVLEYFKLFTKRIINPYKRSIALFLIALISVLIGIKDIDVIFSSLAFTILIYVYFLIRDMIEIKRNGNKEIDSDLRTKEPIKSYTPKKEKIIVATFTLIFICLIILGAIIIPGYYKLLAVGIGLVALLAFYVILILKQNKMIGDPISFYETTLNYQEFSNKVNIIDQRNQNPEVTNLVKILKTNYLIYIDFSKAEELFADTFEPADESHKQLFYIVKLSMLFWQEKFIELKDFINSIKDKNSVLNYNIEVIFVMDDLFVKEIANEKTLEYFNIKNKKNIHNLYSALPLAKYYRIKKDEENYQKILSFVKAFEDKLPELVKSIKNM